jgi:hypothetical protein
MPIMTLAIIVLNQFKNNMRVSAGFGAGKFLADVVCHQMAIAWLRRGIESQNYHV